MRIMALLKQKYMPDITGSMKKNDYARIPLLPGFFEDLRDSEVSAHFRY